MGRICGFTGMNDKSLLIKMCNAMSQGGNKNDFFIDDNISLCSKVSNEKTQLAENEDGNVWIALDGEIYNNILLKQNLEEKRHKFSSSSDAELIVHLYEEYGESCTRKLRGPFAFAIWDSGKKKLLLARDRAGERPLFYTMIDKEVFFGSEIKALLKYSEMKKELSLQGLNHFFSWGHIPAPYTLFKGVRKIPPAQLMIFEKGKGKFLLREYWTLDFSKIDYEIGEDAWCKTVYKTLTDSIRVRLKNPPFGILLGGVDSSATASMMKKLTCEPIESFTINYEEEKFNEPYAKFVSDWLGIEEHEKVLYAKDVIRILPKVVYLIDDPKAEMSTTIPTYLALELAKRHVKTVFTADGADTAFWGNPPCNFYLRPSLKTRLISKFPRIIREGIVPVIRSTVKKVPRQLQEDSVIIAEIRNCMNACFPFSAGRIFDEDELQELLHFNQFDVYFPFLRCLKNGLITDVWDQVRLTNKIAETVGWGISRLERISSACSLNLRLPFEDHKVKEIASKIPPYLKQPNRYADKYIWRKTILKYALLPKKVIVQQKRGFGEDLARFTVPNWLEGELSDYVRQTVYDVIPYLRLFFDERSIKNVLCSGSADKKFTLLIFALWYKTFFLDD